jgi:23S rRNA (adenine2503-C2)-methyltransferase
MDAKCFASSEGNVWKYVFHFPGNRIAEAVLYRYGSFEERTVLCVSVQSGCPVGCTFCGTGNQFIGNLTKDEIAEQVSYVLFDKQVKHWKCKKFQIMFMSMGEPFLNYENVKKSIMFFDQCYPRAQLLISTIAPTRHKEFKDFLELSECYEQVGLQFSIHSPFEEVRNQLIPYKNKLSLRQLRDYGIEWWSTTGRKPYCNHCIREGFDASEASRLMDLFPPNVFCFTFSVLCSKDENMKKAGFRDLSLIRLVEQQFTSEGYNTRVFDPAGQDDIGGGCGQLWYVQKHLQGGNDGIS